MSNMGEHMPNVVERAAALLERSPGAPNGEDRNNGALPAGAAPGAGDTTSPGPRPVTINQTKLAARGISLPGTVNSRTVDEFRAVKMNVLAATARARRAGSGDESRIILVTSSKAGEGKTFTAINLALGLAYEKDTSALLIDADPYTRSAIRYLGVPSDQGWVDSVAGDGPPASDLVLRTDFPGLEILPSGKERPEIPELISSRGMKQLLDELVYQNPRRYIIIDSLPCLTSTEPVMLAGLAGQTLMVVGALRTSREDVDSSLRALNMSSSISLVLNKVEPVLTERGYSYYSYAGYPRQGR